MRVLVTGTKGQLARALLERGPMHGIDVVAIGRPQLDLSSGDDLTDVVAAIRPDAIVNAAAYTAVDKAESEPDLAEAVNGRGAGIVAMAAAALSIPVLQISTDYVFDGATGRPYREGDKVAPLGEYGRSKLAGERAVADKNRRHVILRTGWVYAPFGHNFVCTMLRLAQSREEVAIVADQLGVPNYSFDVADGIIRILQNIADCPGKNTFYGTFHLTSDGEVSWADFAKEIFLISKRLGGPSARVRPIATSDYPTPARRPAYACLDATKVAQVHGVRLPAWRSSLERCMTRLLSAEERGAVS